MIASRPTTINAYLKKKKTDINKMPSGRKKTKLKGHLGTAETLAASRLQLIIRKKGKDTTKEADVIDLLTKLSVELAKLGGVTKRKLPKAPVWKKGTGKPKSIKVTQLHTDNKEPGSPTGSSDPGTTGWAKLKKKGLTKKGVPDRWVRLHLINNEKFGGLAEKANLVPGPHSVNRGPQFEGFDTAVRSLLDNNANVIWIKANVDYHSGKARTGDSYVPYAKKIKLKSGLVAYNDLKSPWNAEGPAKISTSIDIVKPPLAGLKIMVSLNHSTGTIMRSSGLDLFDKSKRDYAEVLIKVIKKNRPYGSFTIFESKLWAAEATSRKLNSTNVPAIISEINSLKGKKIKLS